MKVQITEQQLQNILQEYITPIGGLVKKGLSELPIGSKMDENLSDHGVGGKKVYYTVVNVMGDPRKVYFFEDTFRIPKNDVAGITPVDIIDDLYASITLGSGYGADRYRTMSYTTFGPRGQKIAANAIADLFQDANPSYDLVTKGDKLKKDLDDYQKSLDRMKQDKLDKDKLDKEKQDNLDL
jgi:hypothetical protein